jgi:hypothetical protein
LYNENLRKGLFLDVHQYSATGFEVVSKSNGLRHTVDLTNNTCTCGSFWEFQFPCIHAAAALRQSGLLFEEHVDYTYLTASLKDVYQATITPVSTCNIFADNVTKPPFAM